MVLVIEFTNICMVGRWLSVGDPSFGCEKQLLLVMVPGRLISVADDLPLESVPLSFGWVNESTPPRGRKAADGFGADKYSSRVFMDGGNAVLVFSSREGAVRSSSCRL